MLTNNDDIHPLEEAPHHMGRSRLKEGHLVQPIGSSISSSSSEPSGNVGTRRAGGADGGGCMLKALNKCCPGVLTAEDLDAEITSVYEEVNGLAEWAPDGFKKEWCGTPGASWHQDCIVKALKKKYPGGYSWRKQSSLSIIHERGHGKFYVHGILNKLLWPDEDQAGNWQHTICVDTDTGKFWDDQSKGRMVQEWLQCEKKEHLWMAEIWCVYKLEVPSLSGSSSGSSSGVVYGCYGPSHNADHSTSHRSPVCQQRRSPGPSPRVAPVSFMTTSSETKSLVVVDTKAKSRRPNHTQTPHTRVWRHVQTHKEREREREKERERVRQASTLDTTMR